MNRQLYADGTGIAQLIGEQQAVAQDELTEEQIQAQLPIDLQATFQSLLDAGLSPEQAKIAIREQLKQISMASKDYSSYQPQLLEPGEEMGNVFISQPNPPGYAMGGITGLRQGYFLGGIAKSIGKGISGLVKGATGAVKDIVSSPIGKVALLAAGAYYAPMLFGASPGLAGLKSVGGLLTNMATSSGALGALKTGATILGGASLMSSLFGSPEKAQELYRRNPEAVRNYLRKYYTNVNPKATPEEIDEFVSKNTAEYATGGRVGYREGKIVKTSNEGNDKFLEQRYEDYLEKGYSPSEAAKKAYDDLKNNKFTIPLATGGRVGLAMGGLLIKAIKQNPEIFTQLQMSSPVRQLQAKYMRNLNPQRDEEEILKYIRENAAYGGPMGQPRQNQGGIMELDYRNTGGFVPVGIKEKADDVPAMLSKNEFVFTADAVRGMGNGNIDLGAKRLYNQMKTLENGGIA